MTIRLVWYPIGVTNDSEAAMVTVKINGRAFQSPVAAISIANGNSMAATALLEMVSVNTTVRI